MKSCLFLFITILLTALSCQPSQPAPLVKKVLPALHFSVSYQNNNTLKNKRRKALQIGILESRSEDYVPATIRFEGQEIPAQIRLKGDWLDHQKSSKWSFRVKLADNYSILGMEQFSLQNPRTRAYLDEWFFHQLLEQEDLLTPHYSFVQVWWNKEYKGIYALEEHFCKTLLARQQRKEGPILKLAEDGFWQLQAYRLRNGKDLVHQLPDFEAADILPFQKKRVLADSLLYQAFLAGRQQLKGFKEAKAPASNFLDIDAWAKYYALADLFEAYHSLRWHNLRFYYNASKARLEPIIFDANGPKGTYRWFSKPYLSVFDKKYDKIYLAENYMIFYLFNEKSFREKYLAYLTQYSQADFLKQFKANIQNQLHTFEQSLQTENVSYQYNFEPLLKNAAKIRDFLKHYKIDDHPPLQSAIYPPFYENCPLRTPIQDLALKARPSEDGKSLILSNYLCQDIQIHATGPKKSKPIHELKQALQLPAFDIYQQPPLEKRIPFIKGSRYVFYAVPNIDYWYKKRIAPFPKTEKIDFLKTDSLQIDTSIFKWNGTNLQVKAGQYQLSSTVIIPASIPLEIQAGAQIDLINGAACFFYGAVEMLGTEQQKISFHSSDNSGKGVHFINNPNIIRLNHTHFSQLSSFNESGFTLSGMVNIVEAKAIIDHCQFSQNDSEDALNIVRSNEFVLTNSHFQKCKSDALDVDFSKVTIKNGRFSTIKGDALDFSGSTGKAENLNIQHVADKGLSIGEASNLTFNQVDCNQTKIGVAVKDGSSSKITNITLSDNHYDFAVFNKKIHYGDASLSVEDFSPKKDSFNYLLETKQRLNINGKSLKANYQKGQLVNLLYE
jgi:hypothetical protein